MVILRLVGGWWLVVGGCWLLVGGWWLVVGGCWLVVGGWWLKKGYYDSNIKVLSIVVKGIKRLRCH